MSQESDAIQRMKPVLTLRTKQCRIRRVKCDETRPACIRCESIFFHGSIQSRSHLAQASRPAATVMAEAPQCRSGGGTVPTSSRPKPASASSGLRALRPLASGIGGIQQERLYFHFFRSKTGGSFFSSSYLSFFWDNQVPRAALHHDFMKHAVDISNNPRSCPSQKGISWISLQRSNCCRGGRCACFSRISNTTAQAATSSSLRSHACRPYLIAPGTMLMRSITKIPTRHVRRLFNDVSGTPSLVYTRSEPTRVTFASGRNPEKVRCHAALVDRVGDTNMVLNRFMSGLAGHDRTDRGPGLVDRSAL